MNQNTDTDALSVLGKYKSKIDQAVTNRLNIYQKRWQSPIISADSAEALQCLIDFSARPGKRVRGALAWFTYDQLSQKSDELVGANLAVALELIQNYLLIIDDVMDRSDMRRGQPTVHKLYETKLNSKSTQTHVSDMMAINIGLLGQHLANDLILNCHESDKNIKQTLNLLHQNIIMTVYGQIDDLLSAQHNSLPSQKTIYSIYEAKSSYYTFINPLQMGAALAGKASQALLDTLTEFGKPAGIAFQLKDDILGMFGDSRETGKPNLDDLREGKRTLLIAYTLEGADRKDQAFVLKHLGDSNITIANHRKVCEIIEASGAKQRVEQEAFASAQTAINVINKSQLLPQSTKEFYAAIVEYAVKRQH